MGEPIRVQRKRTKGWRMPPNTRYVGRPTLFGNPFTSRGADGTDLSAIAVKRYREWLHGKRDHGCNPIRPSKAMILELRGMNLACWCAMNKPCHVDVLLEIANV